MISINDFIELYELSMGRRAHPMERGKLKRFRRELMRSMGVRSIHDRCKKCGLSGGCSVGCRDD